MATSQNSPQMAVKVVDGNGNRAQSTLASATGKVLAADGQIKAAAGVLYAVILSWSGVTADDPVEIINSLTSTGTSLFTVALPVAAGTATFYPPVGIEFDTGMYYDVTLSGGSCTATFVYS